MEAEQPELGEKASSAMVDAMGHPVRMRVLAVIAEEPGASAQEISERIGEPVDKIRYQLRQLREAGLVTLTEERARRGVVERFYRVAGDIILDAEDISNLSSAKRMRISTEILKLIFSDVSAALRAGTLDARDEHCMVRVPAQLDSEGWLEMAAVHLRALDEVEQVRDRSEERLRGSAEEPIPAMSTLLCYERAPSSKTGSPPDRDQGSPEL
jgi:DNA-binding transcriptional ArsR family regulator